MTALDTLLEAVGETIRPDDRVLELGCGTGRLTGDLASRAASVVAFDPSPVAIGRAAERHGEIGNVVFVQGDGETLDGVDDQAVDLVVVHELFRRLASAKAQLGYVVEAGRVLAPGGRAIFSLSTDPSAPAQHSSTRRDLLRAVARPSDRPPAAYVPLEALGAVAVQGGLALERIEGAGTRDTVALALRASCGA